MTDAPAIMSKEMILADAGLFADFYKKLSPTYIRTIFTTAVLQSCLQEEPTTPFFFIADSFIRKLDAMLDTGALNLTHCVGLHRDAIAKLKAAVKTAVGSGVQYKRITMSAIKGIQGTEGYENLVKDVLDLKATHTEKHEGSGGLLMNPIYLMHAGTEDQYQVWNLLSYCCALSSSGFTDDFNELLTITAEPQ